jgi:hypothetical protein
METLSPDAARQLQARRESVVKPLPQPKKSHRLLYAVDKAMERPYI